MDPVTIAGIISAIGGLFANMNAQAEQKKQQRQQMLMQYGQPDQGMVIQGQPVGMQRSQSSPMDAAAFISQIGGY